MNPHQSQAISSYYVLSHSSTEPKQLQLIRLGNALATHEQLSEWHRQGKLMSSVPVTTREQNSLDSIVVIAPLKFAALFIPEPCTGLLLGMIASVTEQLLKDVGCKERQPLPGHALDFIGKFLPYEWQGVVKAAKAVNLILTVPSQVEERPSKVRYELEPIRVSPLTLPKYETQAYRNSQSVSVGIRKY